MDKNMEKDITKKCQQLINFDNGLIISSSIGACMIGSTAQIMTCWTLLTKKLIDDKVVTEEEIRQDFELLFMSMDELKSMVLDKLINLKEKLDKKIQEKKGE